MPSYEWLAEARLALSPAWPEGRLAFSPAWPEALAALFGQKVPTAPVPLSVGAAVTGGPADARAQAALQHYNKAIERLKAGDWSGFGTELDALKPLLQQLSGQH